MSEQPNILYIFTDEQSALAMSYTGNKDLKTPAMDFLAREGACFEKAYCTFPLCTPARASMFTGRMPHEVGLTDNGKIGINPDFKNQELGNKLSNAGYECVYGGKWHIPEFSIPEGHGFKNICDFNDFLLADNCIEFIKQEHKKPFFMVTAFDNPHNICQWARNQPLPWGDIEEVKIEECPNLPANYSIPAYEPQALRIEQEECKKHFPGRTFTDDDWRRYRYVYYRLVEKVDADIARILEALKEQDLYKNTLIIFSSDHGDGMGAHKWNQKLALYEESVRVPLLFFFKDKIKSEYYDRQHLVSGGLDLYATICDYAGVEVPDGIEGMSLKPILEGHTDIKWRNYLVAQTFFGPSVKSSFGTRGRMLRTDKYKYIMYTWGKNREQLFDMENDQGEMVNLAVEAKYKCILDEHRKLLKEWLEKNDDKLNVSS